MRIHRSKKIWMRILIYFSIFVIVLAVNVPFFLMVQKAFTPDKELAQFKDTILGSLKLDNFIVVLTRSSYARSILNSIIVSFLSSFICILVSSLIGYAMSRFKSRFFKIYSFTLFVLEMFPLILLLVPLFMLFQNLSLIDTPVPVIIMYTALSVPFSSWMFKSYFDTIPFEIEESAFMDGCNRFGTYFRIILPIALPGLTTIGIVAFIFAWGEYMLASIFITSTHVRTLTIGMQMFRQQYATSWGSLMAAAFLAAIPSFLLLLFAQRYIIKGLASSAIKS